MKYRSVSIYTMWTYISRFLFLLIIPLIQQIILSVTGIKEIIYTMWPSMTILGIILIISFIKYKSLKYAINKNNLFLNKGFLIKRKLAIPIRSINVIDKKCTIILSPQNRFVYATIITRKMPIRNYRFSIVAINYP